MEHGNPALDCLQSYIDALVELGRMDDGRLGLHFFEEWRCLQQNLALLFTFRIHWVRKHEKVGTCT